MTERKRKYRRFADKERDEIIRHHLQGNAPIKDTEDRFNLCCGTLNRWLARKGLTVSKADQALRGSALRGSDSLLSDSLPGSSLQVIQPQARQRIKKLNDLRDVLYRILAPAPAGADGGENSIPIPDITALQKMDVGITRAVQKGGVNIVYAPVQNVQINILVVDALRIVDDLLSETLLPLREV